MTAFDLAALAPEKTSMPLGSGRGRSATPNPMLPHLKRSFDEGQAYGISCPDTDTAKALYSKTRNAATKLGIGCRIVFTDPKGTVIAYRSVPELDAKGVPIRKQYVDKADGTPLVEEDGSPAMYTVTHMTFLKGDKPYKGAVTMHYEGIKKQERKPAATTTDDADSPADESDEATAAATDE